MAFYAFGMSLRHKNVLCMQISIHNEHIEYEVKTLTSPLALN